MIIQKIETWWVRRNKCLFDDKRKGKSAMDWDVLVLKLTTDNGIEGIATALAARSGNVTEAYIHDNIAPVVLGRSPYDHEKILHELLPFLDNLVLKFSLSLYFMDLAPAFSEMICY